MTQCHQSTRVLGISLGLALWGLSLAPAALAGPILADDGIVYIEKNPAPLGTSPVADPGGNPVGMIPFNGGQILLEDYAGDALDTYDPNPSWWNAPGVAYTTHTSGILIDFVDLNVTGFTFNIGANMNAMGWIKAYYNDGSGHELSTSWFSGIGPTQTPGFGVYVHNPAQSCAQITRVEIDPTFEWGVGNFGIAESQCGNVPEPGFTNMLVTGLLTLFVAQILTRRRQPQRIASRYDEPR